MQVFIQTDRHIALTEKQRERFEQDLAKAMGHFDARLTRIEAHLSDVNSARGGDNDKRRLLEARPSGRQPLAVDHQAPTLELAIAGASSKLVSAMESTFGRLASARRGWRPPPGRLSAFHSRSGGCSAGPVRTTESGLTPATGVAQQPPGGKAHSSITLCSRAM